MKEDMYAMREQLEQIKKRQEQENLKFSTTPVVIPNDANDELDKKEENEENVYQKSIKGNFGFINLFGLFSLSSALIIAMIGIRLLG